MATNNMKWVVNPFRKPLGQGTKTTMKRCIYSGNLKSTNTHKLLPERLQQPYLQS